MYQWTKGKSNIKCVYLSRKRLIKQENKKDLLSTDTSNRIKGTLTHSTLCPSICSHKTVCSAVYTAPLHLIRAKLPFNHAFGLVSLQLWDLTLGGSIPEKLIFQKCLALALISVAQLVGNCSTKWKTAGSIPARAHVWAGVWYPVRVRLVRACRRGNWSFTWCFSPLLPPFPSL